MIFPYAYRNGLIAAMIATVYYIVAYFSGLELYTNFLTPWIFFIGFIIFFIITLKKIKKSIGSLSFAQGFFNFLIMSVILLLISNFVNYLILYVIDPEFGIQVNDMVINKVIDLMESMGAPEDSISDAIFEMEEKMESQGSIVGFLTDTFTAIFWFSVIGLITAAILKSKNELNTETID
jgi:hypothetical protein